MAKLGKLYSYALRTWALWNLSARHGVPLADADFMIDSLGAGLLVSMTYFERLLWWAA